MTTRFTIAFVSDAIYPYNKGGKETRLYELSTSLAKLGYDVHIYCMKWWKGEDVRIEDGVHLHGICPYIPLYEGQRRSIKQGIIFGLSCFRLLTAKFDIADIDHMPFFPIYSMRIVCWIRRKKMIGTWNEVWGRKYWTTYLGQVKGTIASLIEKFSVYLPDRIIAISPLTRDNLISEFQVSKQKITVIPCGYNKHEVQQAKRMNTSSDIIFVGRLLSHKNVDVLLRAVRTLKIKFPKILCRVIGVGPELKNLQLLSRELGVDKNVTFHEELSSHKEVLGWMKSSKVFVLPSTREGFGIVVLEANACGLPVITIDHKDNAARLIAQYVVPLKETVLADKITTVLKSGHEEVKASMEDNSNKYSWQNVVDTYISFLKK